MYHVGTQLHPSSTYPGLTRFLHLIHVDVFLEKNTYSTVQSMPGFQQEAPETASRRPQEALKTAQEAPKTAQEAPKTHEVDPKRPSRLADRAPNRSKLCETK